MMETDNLLLLLLTLLFLLYHICRHSFLKSCYLKKCFNFCVVSLFYFFKAFKMGRNLTSVVLLGSMRDIFKKRGRRSVSSGL